MKNVGAEDIFDPALNKSVIHVLQNSNNLYPVMQCTSTTSPNALEVFKSVELSSSVTHAHESEKFKNLELMFVTWTVARKARHEIGLHCIER